MHLRAAILILYQAKCPMCTNFLKVKHSRKSNMSDEINYTKEKHSNEQDQQDISEYFQSVSNTCAAIVCKRKLNTAISNMLEH